MPSVSKTKGVIELPFDEHLTSSNPALSNLSGYLLPILLKKLKLERVTKSYQVVLEILILNFFIVHKADKDKRGNIQQAIPLSAGHYSKGKRFNQNNKISFTILKAIKEALEELKYIKQVSFHVHGEIFSKTRTFVPTAKFYKLMDKYRLKIGTIGVDADSFQTVRMRDVKPKRIKGQKTRPKGKLVDYDLTPDVIDWIDKSQAFNFQARLRPIDLYVTDKEMVTIRKKLTQNDEEKEEQFRYIPFHHKFIYRVFNNRKWDNGGRFYGAFWQAIPSAFRHRITIDNQITTEKDYTAIHFYLLYHEAKADYPEGLVEDQFFDPYELSQYNEQWAHKDIQFIRRTTKLAMNIMLNADSDKAGISACRHRLRKRGLPKGYKTWKDFTDHIREVHSDINFAFCSGKGIEYQFLDSQVANRVMEIMATEGGCLALPVHDSFIVKVQDEMKLEEAMFRATKEILGITIPVTIAGTTKKVEYSDSNYLPVSEVNPDECTGYFERLDEWNESYPMKTERQIPDFTQANTPEWKIDLRLVDKLWLTEEQVEVQRQQLAEGIEEADPYARLNRSPHMADPDAL
jgi:hypothetical protein